ncbi:hypothetical protein GQ457_12G006980 [Hibiscus cannabinus]
MHNQSSSSKDSESVREEEQPEQEVFVGEDHRFDECREIGEKLTMDVGVVVVVDEQDVDGAGECDGLVLEGSNAEVVVSNGKNTRRGHPRKDDILSLDIVDISLSDSNLLHRKEAILKEAAVTVDFGKLLGAKTIGSEEVIVHDIPRFSRKANNWWQSFLKVWNQESFGSVDLQIDVTTDLLNDLEERDGVWKIKVHWLGDQNTRFFQQATKIIGMHNFIGGLQLPVEGSFEPIVSLSELSEDYRGKLELPFTEMVWEVIRCGNGCKAPGPYGYSLEFYKMGWLFLKEDVMGVFHIFHESGALSKGLNSSFVVLLQKYDNPLLLLDYRPICLFNSLYKIVASVLAARLELVLVDLVSDMQSVFVKGRQILGRILLVNEFSHFLRSRASGSGGWW